MKKLAIIFFSLLISSMTFSQNVYIYGKVINNSAKYKTLSVQNLLTKQTLASTDLSKSPNFNFKLSLKQPQYLGLVLTRNVYLMLIAQPGDKIHVILDASNINNSTVTGSPQTQVLIQANKIDQQIKQELTQCQKKVQEHQFQLYSDLILKNLGKISTVLIAERLPLNEKYLPVHKKLAQSLEKYKSNSYVLQYIKSVNAYDRTKIGATAPDIALPDIHGDTVRLSSLRGKYVLVDFWAAWCRPCRAENPNLLKAYKQFHDKGFTIYSISLDRSKQAWLAAIKADGTGLWYQVSDLKGWNSSAATLYGVTAIPSNFLLDPNGKIIARNLRGKDLIQTLDQIFNKK
jgi:peroxiredoxin